ncbi:MAG: PAS domain S-box protein [Desulfovibrionaceae bacterium]
MDDARITNPEAITDEMETLRSRVHALERELSAERYRATAAQQEFERREQQRDLELNRLNKLLEMEVAEREEHAERLAETRRQLDNAFRSSLVGIYRSSPEGRFLSANTAFARMIGYDSPEELMELVTDIQQQIYVNPEDRAAHIAAVNERDGQPMSRVLRWRRRDGTPFWVQLDKHTVNNDQGGIQFFEGIARDVTESKRVQDELAASEQRLKTVADYTYDWEYWRSPDGRLIWVSPSCERITGYPADAFLEDPDLVQRIIVPEDRRQWNAHVEAESLQAPTHTFDFRIRTRAGEVRWIGHNCHAVYDDAGNFIGRRASNQDITVRKGHERELAEQFSFIQTLIDAAPTPIFYKDLDGVYLGCNSAFADHVGLPREQIIGRTVHDLEKAEDAALHSDMDRRLLEDGERTSYILDDSRKPDERRSVVVSKASFESASGRPAGVIGVITDITEQLRAEEQLRKLTQAVEQSPISIVITDTNGTIEYVNPYFCRLTGYTAQEARGGNPRLLKSGRHDQEYYAELWRTISGGGQWRGEFVNRKKSGALYWEKCVISPIKNPDGVITHYVALKEDITERKHAEERLRRSEARYRQVVEGTDNLIAQMDAQGRFTYLNPAAEEFYGLPEGTWRGVSAFEAIHPEDRPALRDALRQWRAEDTRRQTLETRQLGPDGDYHTLALDIQFHRDKNGGLLAVSSIARDVSEQKKLEELKHDVEKITRHDLKSPLMGIISVPQILRDVGNLTEEQNALLAAIEESGFRMLSMINLSLDLYKMEMGTYVFHPTDIDLLPVVRKVADDVAKAMQIKAVTVSLLVEDAPAETAAHFHVEAEELLCYSLFSNLVTNAAEASPQDGEVRILMNRDGAMATIAIHNQGTVPECIRELFFEKYVTAGKAKGTGLGTYSARLIAETQNGSVELTETGDNGTVVTVRLRAANPR